MLDWLRAFAQEYGLILGQGTAETLYMVAGALVFSYLLGLPLGVLVTVTGPKGIRPNRVTGGVAQWIVGLGRSIPFVILMIALIPLTRLVVGTSIGPTAAIVPLVIGAAPFVARMVESSLEEIDHGVIETAQAMGATVWQIICKVYLPEAVPSLVRGCSITAITLIGYSAMAGTVGGRGLGDIAIRFGYYRYDNTIMLITVAILVIIVQIFQEVGMWIATKSDRRK